ncbi:MAG: hypothetical protein JRG90_01105 [Deltaproteobacteria bacterium]|nr:hypothetical protein [Deltaproteobacteria bacterium]
MKAAVHVQIAEQDLSVHGCVERRRRRSLAREFRLRPGLGHGLLGDFAGSLPLAEPAVPERESDACGQAGQDRQNQ